MTPRHDYAHPLHLDAGSQQIARAGYPEHVDQMIRQLLLTTPGERVCLPEFGCGIRQLLFAGQSEAMVASLKIQVRQSIDRWLGDHVQLQDVEVHAGAIDQTAGLDEGAVLVVVSYVLRETLTPRQVELKVH